MPGESDQNGQSSAPDPKGASKVTGKSSSTPANGGSGSSRPLFVPNSAYDVPATSAPRGSTPSARGTGPKITFKPKAVPRRKRDGAPESLLSLGSGDNNGDGPSEAHLRRAERGGRGTGRGRGRGARPEAPLMASGPFAQGPAISSVMNARGRGSGSGRSSGPGGPGRMMEPNRVTTFGPASQTDKKQVDKTGKVLQEEFNYDDAGQPMQNLLRMRDDTSDYWAPVTTDRVERKLKEAKIAAGDDALKQVKIKVEAEDLGFIDVKTEQSESTITSRVPSPDSLQQDDVAMPDVQPAAESDDEDIAMPTAPMASAPSSATATTKEKAKSGRKKETLKTMTAEEAEEQERFAIDLASLRTNFERGAITDDSGLIFIQVPDILPYWQPDPDEEKNMPFVKTEDVKEEIVEIDQREVTKAEAAQQDDVKDAAGSAASPANTTRPKSSDSKSQGAAKDDKSADVKVTGTKTAEPGAKKKKIKPMAFPPPEGNIGQLHIHRSGRITAEWGDILMEVGTGSECGFLQEVVVLDAKTERSVWSLGSVNSRMMMAPNLDDLLGRA